jgi:DNA-3-methyladenine glycosylase II
VPVIPERPQGLETLVLLILEQQVLIQLKLLFKIKGRDKIFDPAVLMDLSDQEFRNWRKPAKNILYQSIVICCN